MRSSRILYLIVVLLLPYSTAGADSFFFRVEDVDWHFAWGMDYIPTGADITIGYGGFNWIAGVESSIEMTFGAGYEGFETYRDVDYMPHTEIVNSAGHDKNLEFNKANILWALGARQGLLWNPEQQRNLLEAFLFYRGRYDRYLDGRVFWGTDPVTAEAIRQEHALWQEAFPGTDARGILGNSLIAGFSLNTVQESRSAHAKDGLYAEISVEISPYLPVLGASDFYRINLKAKYFKTLFSRYSDLPERRINILLCEYAALDWADAERSMPLYVMQTLGGLNLRYGLADSVRGFEKYSWDTQFKAVNAFEIRANFPSLIHPDVYPGLLLFFDAGYGYKFWGDPDPADPEGGLLLSAGFGVYLNVLDLEYIHLYIQFPIYPRRFDGSAVDLDLDFSLHF